MALRKEQVPPHPVKPILDAVSPLGIDLIHLGKPSRVLRAEGLETLPEPVRTRLSRPKRDSVIAFSLGDGVNATTFVWNGTKPQSGLPWVRWGLARLGHYLRAADALDETETSCRQRLSDAVRGIHPGLDAHVVFGARKDEGFVPVRHVVIYSRTTPGTDFIRQFYAGLQDIKGVEAFEKRQSRPKGVGKLVHDFLNAPFR